MSGLIKRTFMVGPRPLFGHGQSIRLDISEVCGSLLGDAAAAAEQVEDKHYQRDHEQQVD